MGEPHAHIGELLESQFTFRIIAHSSASGTSSAL